MIGTRQPVNFGVVLAFSRAMHVEDLELNAPKANALTEVMPNQFQVTIDLRATNQARRHGKWCKDRTNYSVHDGFSLPHHLDPLLERRARHRCGGQRVC